MLPPDTIAKLNECAQHNFAHSRNVWFFSLAISTIAVALGVAGEGAEIWYEMRLIARERYERFRYSLILERRVQNAKIWGAVGWLVIVIGVAWEGYSEIKVHDFDDRIGECNGAQMTKLQDELDDTVQLARDFSNEVRPEIKELNERRNTDFAEMSNLEKSIASQGARSQLLENSKDAFIKDMKRFSEQKIFLVGCGLPGAEGTEADKLREDLAIFLGKPNGAGWIVEHKEATWDECAYATLGVPPGVGGISLVLSDTVDVASKRSAMDAAKALQDTLNGLGITTRTTTDTRVNSAMAVANAGSFWKLVEDDPKAIFLLVGPNPHFTLSKPNTRTK